MGITPNLFLTDVFHVLYLGAFRNWGAWCFNSLSSSNVFQAPPLSDLRGHAVARFHNDMVAWYPAFEAANPDKAVTRVQQLSIGMVGIQSRPKFEVKGAECKYSMLCFRNLLGHEWVRIRLAQAREWIISINSICRHIEVLDGSPWRIGPAIVQEYPLGSSKNKRVWCMV